MNNFKNEIKINLPNDIVTKIKHIQFPFGANKISKTYWIRAILIVNFIAKENHNNNFRINKQKIFQDFIWKYSQLNMVISLLELNNIIQIKRFDSFTEYYYLGKFVNENKIKLYVNEYSIYESINKKNRTVKNKNVDGRTLRTNENNHNYSTGKYSTKKHNNTKSNIIDFVYPLQSSIQTEHNLYKFYHNDILQYVGISNNVVKRVFSHLSEKDWIASLKEITIKIYYFKSRKELELAEKLSIILENPIHNIVRYTNFAKKMRQTIKEIEYQIQNKITVEPPEKIKCKKLCYSSYIFNNQITKITLIKPGQTMTGNRLSYINQLSDGRFYTTYKGKTIPVNKRFKANTWIKGGKEYWRCKKDGIQITKLKSTMTEEQFLEYVRNH